MICLSPQNSRLLTIPHPYASTPFFQASFHKPLSASLNNPSSPAQSPSSAQPQARARSLSLKGPSLDLIDCSISRPFLCSLPFQTFLKNCLHSASIYFPSSQPPLPLQLSLHLQKALAFWSPGGPYSPNPMVFPSVMQ